MSTRRMLTAELTGPALDLAVAMAKGIATPGRFVFVRGSCRIATLETAEHLRDMEEFHAGTAMYSPSTNWALGGPIIERENISIIRVDATRNFEADWAAERGTNTLETSTEHQQHDPMYQFYGEQAIYGFTPLGAAMRCYVMSKLGREVYLPEELPR